MKKILNIIFLVFFFLNVAYGQKNAPPKELTLSLEGKVLKAKDGLPLVGAKVVLYFNNELIQQANADSKGRYGFMVGEYNGVYKLEFKSGKYITSFFTIDANTVPDNRHGYLNIYACDVPMVDTSDKKVDKAKYLFPFEKVSWNSAEKKLMPDLRYSDEFIKGVFDEYKEFKKKQKAEAEEKAARAEADAIAKKLAEKEARKKSRKIAATLLFAGKKGKPAANVEVKLVDSKGVTVQTTRTNELGNFAFDYLNPDENYLLEINEKDIPPGSVFSMVDKERKEITSLVPNANGKYKFDLLAADTNTLSRIEVEDNVLLKNYSGAINGDANKPLSQVNISLLNDAEVLVQTTKTDMLGKFNFVGLPAGENYLLTISAEDNPGVKLPKKITVTDAVGNKVKEMTAGINGNFRYELLQADENKLSYVYVDDPWLKIIEPKKYTKPGKEVVSTVVISESVYFKPNDASLQPEAMKSLDKIIEIMNLASQLSIELGAHTDAKGSDQANLELSNKRATSAVNYIIAGGIDKTRITGKGYGETKLLNNCGNTSTCSEAEHAKNRRIEFKVVLK